MRQVRVRVTVVNVALTVLAVSYVYIVALSSSSMSGSVSSSHEVTTTVPEPQRRTETRTQTMAQSPSSSGKWKLWHEMTVEERDRSLRDASKYVTKYGAMIGEPDKVHVVEGGCIPRSFPKPGMGAEPEKGSHMLCDPPPPEPCFFISAGISDDYSFDVALADEWGCRGIALDPTIDHNSHLHPKVTFHNIALRTLGANEQRRKRRGGEDWWFSSVTASAKYFGMETVDVLKLDCEGCEFAFTRDVLAEDPKFLDRVGQLTIELHTSKAWMRTTEQLYYFALLFALVRYIYPK